MHGFRILGPFLTLILGACTPLPGDNPLDGRELSAELLDQRAYTNLPPEEQQLRSARIRRLEEQNSTNGLRVSGEAGVQATGRF